MRILLWTSHARAELLARIGAVAGAEPVVVENAASLAREAPGADALVITDFLYTAGVAATLRAGAPRLKWIQLLTAGYDNAAEHGVPEGVILTNVGDALSPAVAVHAVSLLLALQRRIPVMLTQQARHEWGRGFVPQVRTPAGSTVAIIGFGGIGHEIARLLRAFGAHIIGVSRRAPPDALADEVATPAALAAILPRADAVVLALALNPESQSLIAAREFARMKRGAILINIARGAIVDHIALADALKAGTLGGAGLDVTEPEPLPSEHPLWDAPNLILSPHLGGACGPIGSVRLANVAGVNVERFLAGATLLNQIAV